MKRQLSVLAGVALVVPLAACATDEPSAEGELTPVTALVQPFFGYDSFWIALDQGFFEDEGLDVEAVEFSSGTTAVQTFQTGEGDVLTVGDLPSLTAWFQLGESTPIIAAVQGDSFNYQAASRSDITTAQQLVGQTVATRVGSTGSYFLDSYLLGNGVSPDDVDIINLDPPQMGPALCKGEIAAYFWAAPYPDQTVEACPDDARMLTDAEGYMTGYGLLMARGSWLEDDPETAQAFLRALRRGAEFADTDPDTVVKFFVDNYGVDEASARDQIPRQTRLVSLTDTFYADICAEYRWASDAGIIEAGNELDPRAYTDPGPLRAIDSGLADEPPASC